MQINGTVEVKGFLTIEDLDYGDTFAFCDDNILYLLGVNEPVSEYECDIIAIAHRHNDIEDKLVGAPVGVRFSKEDIENAIYFQEQYYDTEIEVL